MRYAVATVGALIVIAGAFGAIMLVPAVLFPVIYESIPGLVAMYVIGTPLALLAGVSSFRATLRHYAGQDLLNQRLSASSARDGKLDESAVAKWGEKTASHEKPQTETGSNIHSPETRTQQGRSAGGPSRDS